MTSVTRLANSDADPHFGLGGILTLCTFRGFVHWAISLLRSCLSSPFPPSPGHLQSRILQGAAFFLILQLVTTWPGAVHTALKSIAIPDASTCLKGHLSCFRVLGAEDLLSGPYWDKFCLGSSALVPAEARMRIPPVLGVHSVQSPRDSAFPWALSSDTACSGPQPASARAATPSAAVQSLPIKTHKGPALWHSRLSHGSMAPHMSTGLL